ncbi:hypothetical protein QYE76_048202 [Lolium multiflorum]|uniref:Uncharacterized protein n=1 Tax=Lolium multiflorum TaxID=4521 RepID=A0AAD8PGZ7_LOLMU|nr:hypothetical protein QYE76_048202 [Lolium multiflorum]
MNPHKWFLTNMDCCCLWVANPQVFTSALSTNPEYLNNIGKGGTEVIDYKDWQIALSRPFRAMKLWVVLRRHGAAGMRAHIRRHVEMAKWFERMYDLEGELAVDALNRKLLVAINTSGRAFMTHFVVDNKFVIRMAMGGAMTQMRHVRDAWKLVKEKAKEVGALPREYAQLREMN